MLRTDSGARLRNRTFIDRYFDHKQAASVTLIEAAMCFATNGGSCAM
jgi:hypothetical protein